MKIILTNDEYEKVEKWLAGDSGDCSGLQCRRCRGLFPKITKDVLDVDRYVFKGCPCNTGNPEYVRKKVRRILKEAGIL